MAYRSGLGQIDSLLAAARSGVERQAQLDRLRSAAERDIERLTQERDTHASVVKRDEKSVAKLEGTSMKSLFYGLLGKREEKLDDDRKALLESALMHQLIESELIAVEVQLEEIATHRGAVEGSVERLESARTEKEAWLAEHGGPASEHLFKLSEESGRHDALIVEITEARDYGLVALKRTDEVLELLGSARNWGAIDMFGGGLIATVVKHGKIDSAKRKQAEAQNALLAFSRELKDVELQLDEAAADIDGFSKFGDYFFDGLIFDWAVQSKIKRSQEAVQQTRTDIATALDTLASQEATLRTRLGAVAAERIKFIESWGGH